MQYKVRAASILLLFLMGGCGPQWSDKREETLRQNSKKIQIGMTRQEVKNLLNKPDFYLPRKDPTRLLYIDGDMEKADSWEYLDPEDTDFAKRIYFEPKTGKASKIERVNSS
jgi:hypothetical protein